MALKSIAVTQFVKEENESDINLNNTIELIVDVTKFGVDFDLYEACVYDIDNDTWVVVPESELSNVKVTIPNTILMQLK